MYIDELYMYSEIPQSFCMNNQDTYCGVEKLCNV